MGMHRLLVGTALLGLMASATPVEAADQLYVPLLTYRTGAFAGSGIPIADGMHDYLEMLNQRDGGIGGVKIAIEECETGYDTARRIRERANSKPIQLVALTGGGLEDDRRRSKEAGFDEHIVKPVPPDVLKALVAREVPRGSGGSE